LDLAHRWKFEQVKHLVIRELEKMDMSPIDRINLYHRYDVDKNILLPRYTSICVREDHLSVGEGRQLGIETALNLAQIRERVRSTPTEGCSPFTARGLTEGDVYAIIKEVFAISEPSTPSTETAGGSRDANGTSASVVFITSLFFLLIDETVPTGGEENKYAANGAPGDGARKQEKSNASRANSAASKCNGI
jgi:hypothetical protein